MYCYLIFDRFCSAVFFLTISSGGPFHAHHSHSLTFIPSITWIVVDERTRRATSGEMWIRDEKQKGGYILVSGLEPHASEKGGFMYRNPCLGYLTTPVDVYHHAYHWLILTWYDAFHLITLSVCLYTHFHIIMSCLMVMTMVMHRWVPVA